jgi:prepilin-type N-terminal cleavage/methylation domain-containing protein
MFSKSANNKGFTLLELIIVMAIIAILSATVILNPGILDNRYKAVDTGNLDLATKLQTQLFTYFLTTGTDISTLTGVSVNADLYNSTQALKTAGIISNETVIPQGVFVLQIAADKTPNVGFSLASSQFKTNSTCYNKTDINSTTDCTVGGFFYVPKSKRLGVK